MKKAIVIILILAAAFSLAACARGSKDGSGVYESVKFKYVGDKDWSDDDGWTLDLRSTGKGVSTRDGYDYACTWSVEGESFTLTESFMGIGVDYTGTLKNGRLELYNGAPESELTCVYVFKLK